MNICAASEHNVLVRENQEGASVEKNTAFTLHI
uniref:Uncharacterized protein n=1 Tax=Arundo donax TaxID=35708 RepID=A0A0A9BWP2_ARUDO